MQIRRRLAALCSALMLAACVSIPADDTAAMRFATINGARIHYETWGDTTKPSVLLVHASWGDWGVFLPSIVPVLSGQYSLVAYDRPGLGYSERQAGAEQLSVQADVAAGVIAHTGVRKPIVVGHSYGAAVALRLVLDQPEIASGLVLICPTIYNQPGQMDLAYSVANTPVVGPVFVWIAQSEVALDLTARIAGAFAPAAATPNFAERAGMIRNARLHVMHANSEDLASLQQEVIKQEKRYPEIKVPVAIMCGDQDRIIPAEYQGLRLAKEIPNARYVVVPNAGHLAQETSPQTVSDLVGWVAAQSATAMADPVRMTAGQ